MAAARDRLDGAAARAPRPRGTAEAPFSWGEALAFAGVNASGLLLIQLERLVIPHVLPLADLALYGVLGAIAGSIYRVMQMGVGFSLLPRLRAAATVVERRQLVAHEAKLVGAMTIVGSAGNLVLHAARSSAGCWPASTTCRARCSWPQS